MNKPRYTIKFNFTCILVNILLKIFKYQMWYRIIDDIVLSRLQVKLNNLLVFLKYAYSKDMRVISKLLKNKL